MEELLKIMDTLLGENGCPWDKEQTHESMIKHLHEEAGEVVDAINQKNMESLKEELGDLLLQVVFHAKLAEKAGEFTFNDVTTVICDKLIRRHTHVFGEDTALSAEDVVNIWNKNKEKEKFIENC